MSRVQIRFWGVRGSLTTPGRATARFGGNTSCVELLCGDERLVLDMGSGLRTLGQHIAGRSPVRATFFLSHYHWDHIVGLPFFGPAYDPRTELVVYGARRLGKGVREILAGQMTNPYFPVNLDQLRARIDYRDLQDGERVGVGPMTVHARELSHPGGAMGFRVETASATLVYATDFEHGSAADDALIELSQGADMLVMDAQYTLPEYDTHRGWGHTTWAECVRVARAAQARRLVLFHHDPGHSDAEVGAIARLARSQFPATDAAREGKEYVLGVRARRTPARAAARRSSRR